MQTVLKHFYGFPLDIKKIVINGEEPKKGQEERYWRQEVPHVMVVKEVSKSGEYENIYFISVVF